MTRYEAAQLRRLREDRGITGEKAAADIGWSRSAFARLEAGLITPAIPTLARLARLYDVPLGSLYDRHDATDPVTAYATSTRAQAADAPALSPRQRDLFAAIAKAAERPPNSDRPPRRNAEGSQEDVANVNTESRRLRARRRAANRLPTLEDGARDPIGSTPVPQTARCAPCGSLGIGQRDAYAARGTCPCRERAS